MLYKVLKKWIKEKSLVIFSNKQVVISMSVLFADSSFCWIVNCESWNDSHCMT